MITRSHTAILVLWSICVALISSQKHARFASINFLFQTTFTHFHATNGAGRTRPLNTPEFPKRVLTSCDSNLSLHRLFSESGVNDEWGMFVTGSLHHIEVYTSDVWLRAGPATAAHDIIYIRVWSGHASQVQKQNSHMWFWRQTQMEKERGGGVKSWRSRFWLAVAWESQELGK